MTWKNRSVVATRELTKKDILDILQVSSKMEAAVKKGKQLNTLKDKVVSTLFFEPSTRTRLSFESAAERLGAEVLGFGSTEGTSITKGETLIDTIRMITQYSDIIVMRHPNDGAAKLATMYSSVPIINAGDGSHDHPSQTLLDLYTIWKEFGNIDKLNIGICGDLKYGRTGRPLSIGLSNFKTKITFIAPNQLRMDVGTIDFLKERGIEVHETESLKSAIPDLDVLYVTRIQRERFPSEEDYLKLKGVYVVGKEIMETAKKNMIVMHPLPRVDEITTDVDKDKRARYFEQAGNGVYVRMALLDMILG